MVREHPTSMRCKACGYDLRSLTEHRCPECGRQFDPGDPRSFLTKPVSGRWYLFLALVGIVLVSTPLLLAYLNDLDVVHLPETDWRLVLWPGMMVTGFVVEYLVLRTGCPGVFGRLVWIEHRFAFVAAVLISSVVVIGGLGMVAFRLIAGLLG